MNFARPSGGCPPLGRLAVLVVEDEPMLRLMAADMIEDAGFEAVEAADATEAVRLLEQRVDIRVMFTDIDMPRGIDGIRLAALVRERWPPMAIILTSGQYDASEIRLPPRALYFAKPYRHSDIVGAMRKMTH